MRRTLAALSIVLGSLCQAAPATAQVSIGISIPGVSIGIYQPAYPDLVLVPGYPVYYAPHARANYFFYDGLYWVYHDDQWYASAWYNGPWDLVDPYYVPLFVLRVPVRYYVNPPVYFHGWAVTAPPRWDMHWGPRWAQHRHGWDHWDRRIARAPAPPPVYQRNYAGDRYPRPEQQHSLRDRHYRYEPRDSEVRRHYQPRPASQDRSDVSRTQDTPREPAVREQRQSPRQEHERRGQWSAPPATQADAAVPRAQPVQRPREDAQRPVFAQPAPQAREPARSQRHEAGPRAQYESRPQHTRERGTQGRGDDQGRGQPGERRQSQERGR